ncbi:MAG TPA: SDR family oxidoreductase [Bacteroidia bacterium]|nr:SDR family oxidoreductase [Bacteroidia bacterium]
MKILLTGANGYIGMRLLPLLVEAGHEVVCVVRDRRRFQPSTDLLDKITIVEFDFLHPEKTEPVFKGLYFDVAYYLIHSLHDNRTSFEEHEKLSAECFVKVVNNAQVKQLVYLSGISNEKNLSPHLRTRKIVGEMIRKSGKPFTIFESGIIVGSGSASFEIIRDLVEKLPVMIAPEWLNTRCQPIAIRNVINYLFMCLLNEKTYYKTFEIGGPEVLTYKEVLLGFAAVRGYKRKILVFPLPLPWLSAHWLYLITSTSFSLARQLVESMKNDVVCKENSVHDFLPQRLIPYPEAISLAFQATAQNMVLSSWKDAAGSDLHRLDINQYIQVPRHGCFKDRKWIEIPADQVEEITNRFFGIGGSNGWYYADMLWRLRGVLDKIMGGVGLLRGRRSNVDLQPGDALDFWRVLLADRKNHRLLLFAEMKLPGEAWLEFSIVQNDNRCILKQTATFRPRGLAGRNYWYFMLPFHYFIFRNMIRRIAMKGKK